MVAEDVIITEEALEVLAVEEVLLQEEKVLVDLEATEVQLLVKAVLDQEVHPVQEEKAVFHLKELQEKVLQKERQDVLKVLVIHQDQKDQEETNTISNSNIKSPEHSGDFFFNITAVFLKIKKSFY